MIPRAVLIGLLGLAFCAGPVSAQTTLAWKFKEGDVFFIDETNVADQNFTIMGKQIQQKNTNRRVSRFEVKSGGPKGSILEQTVLRWEDKQEGGPPVPGPDDLLERLVKGVTFRIHLNPNGTIAKYEGYEALMVRARREFPGDEVKVFESIVTEDLLKSSIEMAFGAMPTNPVKKGDRWSWRLRVPAGPLGIFLFNDTMTYDGEQMGEDLINVSTTFDYLPPKDAAGLPFRITKADLKSPGGKSQLMFDREKGRVISLIGTFPMSGTMTIDVGGMLTSMELSANERRTIRVSDRAPR